MKSAYSSWICAYCELINGYAMFSKRLEDLIQAALEDGTLEDYEKAALVKRAQAEGVDLAELKIYVNSILQRRKKEQREFADARLEENEKARNEALRKCPNCGASMPVMAIVCPFCGHEISSPKVLSSVQELADKIEQISSRLDLNGKNSYEIEEAKNAMNEEIINAISFFPVPNSKQDIVEFLALACSKAKRRGGLWGSMTGRMKLLAIIFLAVTFVSVLVGLLVGAKDDDWLLVILPPCYLLFFGCFGFFIPGKDIIRYNKVAEAWRDKFEQVILKGRSLHGDAEFTRQLNYYESRIL